MNSTNKRSIPVHGQRGSNPSVRDAVRPQLTKHRNQPFCRTSQYMPAGSSKIGLSHTNQPSKVVWELDYGLSDEQFKHLSVRFPGIAFVQTGIDCHDHPIAHTSYRIVWENVMRKLSPGAVVADLAGNPAVNERFNKSQARRERPITVDTFCKVLSTKDSIRAKTRWGPRTNEKGERRWEEMTLYDMYRNEENCARFAKYDTFLMNHVLYYYDKSEINRLLNLNRDSVLIATLHKLEGQNGTINCGEQKYEKDFISGRVVQENVETGESYEHPDPMPWFKNFCYADEHGAMAWTINKGCDDTYIITATSTEPYLVPENNWRGGRIIFNNGQETVEVTLPEVADPPPAYQAEEVVFKTHDLLPGYATNKELRITITHPELYDTLKASMINKPRNARTLQDLTAKAHREAGNNSLVGNNNRIKIKPEVLRRHIFAAWMAGTGHEAEMFEAVMASNPAYNSVNRNLSGKSWSLNSGNAAKQAVGYALKVSAVMRSKEPVHAILTQIDELL